MDYEISHWAPIALFIYRRPDHVHRTIKSLQACDGFEESPLFVFADGPRTETETSAVRATRAAARELLGDRAVFVEQDRNRGLADSVIAGVTELCERFGAVVVVEDDLILHRRFLRFLNEGLERYRDEPRVMQISGHMFDVHSLKRQEEALFLPLTTSWGWATWQRAWRLFDHEAEGWEHRLQDPAQRLRFDLDGNYPYSEMLQRQQSGKVDSWAIRWQYTLFTHDGLGLFPPRALVTNAGFDRSGTHGRLSLPATGEGPADSADFALPSTIAPSDVTVDVFAAIERLHHRNAATRLARRIYQRFFT